MKNSTFYFTLLFGGMVLIYLGQNFWPQTKNSELVKTDSVIKAKPVIDTGLVKKIIIIPKGGSLCKTLGMLPQEALLFAKTNKLKYWVKDSEVFVLVFTGDVFCQTNGVWRKIEPEYSSVMYMNGFIIDNL